MLCALIVFRTGASGFRALASTSDAAARGGPFKAPGWARGIMMPAVRAVLYRPLIDVAGRPGRTRLPHLAELTKQNRLFLILAVSRDVRLSMRGALNAEVW